MTNFEIGSLVVIILAVCEASKYAGLAHRLIPLLAVALGLGGAFIFTGGANFLTAGAGVVVGLATTGGYTALKKLIKG